MGSNQARRRGKGLGISYFVAGVVPVAIGLLVVIVTVFDRTDANDEPVDSSFAGGIVSTLDDSVWYLFGGWLILGGALMAVGAMCGRRGWPLGRTLVALGLLVIGVPGLVFGFGVIYLLMIPTLFFWRHEPEQPRTPEQAAS